MRYAEFNKVELGHRKNRVLGLPTLRGVHIQGLTTNCPAWISSKKNLNNNINIFFISNVLCLIVYFPFY